MKKRLFGLLMVLVLAFGLASASEASTGVTAHIKETESSNAWGYEDNYYVLKNGETATFYYHADYMGSLLKPRNDDVLWIMDLVFDTPYAVKAKSSASWIHIKNTSHGFFMTSDQNSTLKNRTATVKISGKDYSATVKLIQFGTNQMTSVVRNKKKVTVKLNMAKAAENGYLFVSLYKIDDPDNTSQSKTIAISKGEKSVSFTVKAGWRYDISLFADYPIKKSYVTNSTDWVDFTVTKENIGKKETIR